MTSLISPLEQYRQDISEGRLLADDAQAHAMQRLQDLYEALLAQEREAKSNKNLLGKVSSYFSRKQKSGSFITGLYFWGGVGRGKTYLVDAFFDSLPIERKLRLHFHRFMQKIHNELTELQGQSDPLELIAENMAREASVICLDEFFVKDITDAMLLSGLLGALFERGVVLVTTSNIVPSELYKDGLQRQRFLPAIALLQKHTQVINVDGGVDYRLRALEQAELFHFPLDEDADKSLERSFESLSPESGSKGQEIDILGRNLKTIALADDVVWFDFYDLCDGPRSQNDYIELSRIYHAVLISNVPQMELKTDDLARRFINLVDEFYDRRVKLIISAETAIHELYLGGQLVFEFERTQSRLLEMQSHDYLAEEHLA